MSSETRVSDDMLRETIGRCEAHPGDTWHMRASQIGAMATELLERRNLSTPPLAEQDGEIETRHWLTEIRNLCSRRPSVSDAKSKDALKSVALSQSADLGRIMRICNNTLKRQNPPSQALNTGDGDGEAVAAKIGDTVRVLRARNAFGTDVYTFSTKSHAVGKTFVVGRIIDNGYPCKVAFPEEGGNDFWRIDDLEVINPALTHPAAGRVSVSDQMVSCPACSGTGWQGGNELFGACDDCDGRGNISVEQKNG